METKSRHLFEFASSVVDATRTVGELDKLGKGVHKVAHQNEKAARAIEGNSRKTRDAAGANKQTAQSFWEMAYNAENFNKTLAKLMLLMPMWMVFRAIISTVQQSIRALNRSYMEFAKEMGRVAVVTVAAGMSLDQFNDIKVQAIKNLSYMSTSAKDAATAMYHLGTVGLDAAEIQGGFQKILQLSVATMSDVNRMGKLMAGSYVVFGHQIENAVTAADKFNHMGNVLITTFQKENVQMEEMAAAFGMVAAEASTIEFKFEELVATLGVLNTGFLRGSQSGTALARSVARLSQQHELLENITGRAFDPTKPADFMDIMTALHDRFKQGKLAIEDNADLLQVFGQRGIRPIKVLMLNWERFVASVERNKNVLPTALEDAAKAAERTLPAQLTRLGNHFKAAWADIADAASVVLVPALEAINNKLEELEKLGNWAVVAEYMMNESKKMNEISQEITGYLGSFSMGAFPQQIMQANVELEKMKKNAQQVGDALVPRRAPVESQEFDSKAKGRAENELKTRDQMLKRQADLNKLEGVRIQKLDEYLAKLQAGGATELQIAREKIRFMKEQMLYEEKQVSVQKARRKEEEAILKLRSQSAGDVRGMFSGALSDAAKGDGPFFSNFKNNLRENIRNAFIDAAAEGVVNKLFSAVGIDVMLGDALNGLRMERAIINGGLQASETVKMAMDQGGQLAGNHISRAMGGQGYAGQAPGTAGSSLPTGTAAATKGMFGGAFDFLKNPKFHQAMGMGLMAWSMIGGMKGSSSISQAYSTAPGKTTDRVTTRDTVKAKVTNIVNNISFNLEGMSIDDQKAMRLIGDKLGQVIKDTVIHILEQEDISSGNY